MTIGPIGSGAPRPPAIAPADAAALGDDVGPEPVPAADAPEADGETLELSQGGWPPEAPPAREEAWPAYAELFGTAPYVRDPADGRLNDLMRAAMAAEPELRRPPLGPALAAGRIDGEAVKALQTLLRARGFDLGRAGVDGKFGPKTHAALIALLDGEAPPAPTPAPTPPAPAPPAPPAPTPTPGAGGATITGTNFDPTYKLGNPPPAGYRAFKGAVPTGVGQVAKALLGKPHGTETYFELDGKRYVARNEPHYHPPGFKGGPNGWHTGVTVYEAT